MRPRISIWGSVRPSVRRSVRRSVRPSVSDAFVKNGKIDDFVRWNHIIIQSFHHHEDASLALWALFDLSIYYIDHSLMRKLFLISGTIRLTGREEDLHSPHDRAKQPRTFSSGIVRVISAHRDKACKHCSRLMQEVVHLPINSFVDCSRQIWPTD